jgi:hypothetical protein
VKKPNQPYIGDAAMRRFLERHGCSKPFHVVRMRFWGEIVSPSLKASPIATIQGLWPNGLPEFASEREANDFFQTMLGLWNRMAKFQDGPPGVRLQKVGGLNTREALRDAANTRVEELLDGFFHGFMGGDGHVDVPSGVGDILARVEKGIELLARTRNTFRRPPGPDEENMLAELGRVFPEVDRAVHADLNAIAKTVTRWRRSRLSEMADQMAGDGEPH